MKSDGDLKNSISKMLGAYEGHIKNRAKVGKYDFNRDCEDIFCKIFNIVYDANYVNLNYVNYNESNYPAVDLGDIQKQEAIQVTSRKDKKKVKETYEKFVNSKKDISKTFKNGVKVFVLGYLNNKPKIQGIDVIDFTDLYSEIEKITEKEKLVQIDNILHIEYFSDMFESKTSDIIQAGNGVKGKNYLKYLKTRLSKDDMENDKKYFISGLNYLFDELNKMQESVRKLIYISIAKCRATDKITWYDRERIIFNYNALVEEYINEDRVRQLLSIIDTHKHLRPEISDEEPYLCGFDFLDTEIGFDVLYDVVDFCEKNKIDLEEIIVKLDFRQFDE